MPNHFEHLKRRFLKRWWEAAARGPKWGGEGCAGRKQKEKSFGQSFDEKRQKLQTLATIQKEGKTINQAIY